MNFKTTLILLFLLLSFGAYYYFVEQNSMTTTQRDETRVKTRDYLFSQEHRNIALLEKFSFKTPSAEFAFTQRNGKWFQEIPASYPLLGLSFVDELLGEIATQVILPNDQNYKKLKSDYFASPFASIQFEYLGDKSLTLTLGAKLPGTKAFVQLTGDNRIYQIENAIYGSLQNENIVNHYLNRFKLQKLTLIDHLQIDTKEASLVFKKEAMGQWQLAHDNPKPINFAKLQGAYVSFEKQEKIPLSNFKIIPVSHLKLYGLSDPNCKLILKRANNSLVLHVGSKVIDGKSSDPKRYACWLPSKEAKSVVIFACYTSIIEDTTKLLDHVVETRILKTRTSDLSLIKIRRFNKQHEETVVLKYTGNAWQIIRDAQKTAIKAKLISAYLTPFYIQKAENHIHLDFKFKPLAILEVQGKSGGDIERLSLFKRDEIYYLKRSDQSTGFEVSPEIVKSLLEMQLGNK